VFHREFFPELRVCGIFLRNAPFSIDEIL